MPALLALLLAGCRSANKLLLQAVSLQAHGNTQAALKDYIALLARVPRNDHQLISMLETKVGECLLVQGETREAYAALERAIAEDPANTRAHLRLGEVMLVASAPNEAMQQARMVLNAEPNNMDALAVLAQGMALTGKPETASFVFKQILEAEPTRTELALQLAELQVQDNEIDAARDTLHRAAAASVHNPAAWLALGRLEEIAGLPDAAERNYRQAVKVEDSAHTELRLAQFLARNSRIEEAEMLLRQLPASAKGATNLPDFDLLAGRTGAAETEYLQELRRERATGENSAALSARVVESMLQQAQDESASASTIHDAAKWLQVSAAELSPEDELLLRGELALAENNLESAAALAERATTADPNFAAAAYLLGVVDQRRGLEGAAEKDFRKSLQLDSRFSPAMLALGEIALNKNNLELAEHYVASVVLDEPENFRALCLYARVLQAQKRFDEAGQLARRALAANPGSPEPHIILGEVAVGEQHLAGALIEYEQALLRDPHSAVAMNLLEQLYRQGRITRPMIAKMERVAASPPVSAPLMEIAGRLYLDHGWYRDSERALRFALTADPGRRSAAALLAQIYLAAAHPAAASAMLSKVDPAAASVMAASSAASDGSAAKQYEDAVKAGDQSGVAANNLAWDYAMHDQHLDRALELAELAHNLAPQNPEIMDTLGVVRMHRREYSQAISALKQASQLARSPSAANASAVLAQIQAHLRDAYRLSGQATPSNQ